MEKILSSFAPDEQVGVSSILSLEMADSRCLKGIDEDSKKGTCMRWGTSVQKVIRHAIGFCPLEGHPRRRFIMLYLL